MYLAEHFKVNGSYEILINEEIEKNFEKPQSHDGANKCYTSKIIFAKTNLVISIVSNMTFS